MIFFYAYKTVLTAAMATAIALATFGVATAAVAESEFVCDFEWMEKPDYLFLDFTGYDAKIIGEKQNSFLELSNTVPSNFLVFKANVNMFYRPGSKITFKHRELPGNISHIAIGLQTEDKSKFYAEVAKPTAEWQEISVDLSKMYKVDGKPLSANSILSEFTIYARGDDAKETTIMTMQLDDVALITGDVPPVLFSEANPLFFNWRKNMGTVTLEYSQNPDFPPSETTSVKCENNFYTPSEFMKPGLWYYRIISSDGRTLPTEKIELKSSAHKFMTPEIDAAKIMALPRPWLNKKIEMSESEKIEKIALFNKFFALKPMPNPPKFKENDPEYPSFISWYGGVHDRIVISAGVRLQTLAEIYAQTADDSLAPKLLEYAMAVCEWNPEDGSGHSAGDIGAYHVQRGLDAAYDALHNRYDAQTLQPLRDMIFIRAKQVWDHLNPYPRGMRKEYNNHSWLAIYGMAEGALVTLGEVPDSEKYLEFAKELYIGLFFAVQGFDGENGEGIGYWSYGGNFLKLYAEMMKNSAGIDMFSHPWLNRTVMFPIYTCIPNTYAISFANTGKPNHSFKGPLKSSDNYIEGLAEYTGNPYGVWYANTGGEYNGIEAKIPADIPQSIFYPHIGWAVFNTSLTDGLRNVSVAQRAGIFTSGHQHDDQNNILLNGYGDKLLINSGYYDYYGSKHFSSYSTQTLAHNTILVDGQGQGTRKNNAGGKLNNFSDSRDFGFIEGDAGNETVNGGKLSRWHRRTLFIKPEFVITHDIIKAKIPVNLSYLAHSSYPLFAYNPNQYFDIIGDNSELYARVIHPELNLSTSTGYPVNPVRPRGNNEPLDEDTISREWHLSANTLEKVEECDIMVAMQIRQQPVERSTRAKMNPLPCENGRAVEILPENGGKIIVMSNFADGEMKCGEITTTAKVFAVEYDNSGKELRRFSDGSTSIENHGSTAPIELWGATLKGEFVERATDTIYYYSGVVNIPEDGEYSTPFEANVNVIVDMIPFTADKLSRGKHFVVVTSLKKLN